MNENDIRVMVLLGLQSAMLGEVFPKLRCMTCSWKANEVTILAIVDGEIDEDDEESLECIHTELIASLPETFMLSNECVRVDSDQPIGEHLLMATVYKRRE